MAAGEREIYLLSKVGCKCYFNTVGVLGAPLEECVYTAHTAEDLTSKWQLVERRA